MEGSYFRTSDGIEVYLKKWLSDSEQVKGVVQLVHGMVEHISRYDEFAGYLNENGYHVIGHDQRGHGKTASRNGKLGYLGDGDGFLRLVHDVKDVNAWINQEFSLPVFIIGHSMGSFVVRRSIQLFPSLTKGVVLIGTAGPSGVMGEVGKGIAAAASFLTSPASPGNILTKLTFGSYNNRFSPCKTDLDWLSRDHTEVERYQEDPLCGFTCSHKFYVDLFNGLTLIHRKSELKKMSPSVRVFLISGSVDPVGNDGKGVFSVARQLQKTGVEDVEVKLYDEGRHELLKETNRRVIFQDILTKIESWRD
ncbi:alpha/beta fold hydrolase [Jeotgalibacillus proteolyticus]|uniref:alpha/beta fold hydrolase n=1 Tax=Jeotgalibacillus proteolyticus TaxID=2082395 RepID=UPI003CF16AAD